jgi:hypothetical protein
MTDPKRARCFDKDWTYTPSGSTDIRKLFKRIEREQKKAEPAPATNVKPLRKKGTP